MAWPECHRYECLHNHGEKPCCLIERIGCVRPWWQDQTKSHPSIYSQMQEMVRFRIKVDEKGESVDGDVEIIRYGSMNDGLLAEALAETVICKGCGREVGYAFTNSCPECEVLSPHDEGDE